MPLRELEAEPLGARTRIAHHHRAADRRHHREQPTRVVEQPGVTGKHEPLAPAIADRIEHRAGCRRLASMAREPTIEHVEDTGEHVQPHGARQVADRDGDAGRGARGTDSTVTAFGEMRLTSRRSSGEISHTRKRAKNGPSSSLCLTSPTSGGRPSAHLPQYTKKAAKNAAASTSAGVSRYRRSKVAWDWTITSYEMRPASKACIGYCVMLRSWIGLPRQSRQRAARVTPRSRRGLAARPSPYRSRT